MANSRTNRLHAVARWAARLVVLLASVLALILVIAWMAGTFHRKIPPGKVPLTGHPAVGRATVRVSTLPTTERVDAVGTIQSRWRTDVASRLLATVKQVNVDAGDTVRAGQLLVTLDDRELKAQLGEAEAAVGGIQADLAVRQREFERYRQMFAGKAVSKEQFDRIQGAYEVAQAQLRRAQQQVGRLRVLLSYTQIKASTGGVVADRYVDPGDLAAPGKPLLTLQDPRQLELHGDIRENLMGNIRVGMKLRVRIDALGRTLTGTVREIVPRAETASRSVLVKVVLPQDQLAGAYVGMFGRLSIPVGQIQHVVVPATAVQYVGQLEMVDVVTKQNTLQRRYVRIGRRLRDQLEILSGLQVGETVAMPETQPPAAGPKTKAS